MVTLFSRSYNHDHSWCFDGLIIAVWTTETDNDFNNVVVWDSLCIIIIIIIMCSFNYPVALCLEIHSLIDPFLQYVLSRPIFLLHV
jgi:hypothetical protein